MLNDVPVLNECLALRFDLQFFRAYCLRSTSCSKLLFGCNQIRHRSISRTSYILCFGLHKLLSFVGVEF